MPARKEEVHHAKEEGIHFRMLTNPKAILGDENGFVRAMTCVEMELGEPDERGRRRPGAEARQRVRTAVETVVVAIGNSPNPLIKKTTPDLPTETWGGITTDEHGRTGKKHVYAGRRRCDGRCNGHSGNGRWAKRPRRPFWKTPRRKNKPIKTPDRACGGRFFCARQIGK